MSTSISQQSRLVSCLDPSEVLSMRLSRCMFTLQVVVTSCIRMDGSWNSNRHLAFVLFYNIILFHTSISCVKMWLGGATHVDLWLVTETLPFQRRHNLAHVQQ